MKMCSVIVRFFFFILSLPCPQMCVSEADTLSQQIKSSWKQGYSVTAEQQVRFTFSSKSSN